MDDDSDLEEFLHMLQLMLAEQEGDNFEDELLVVACIGLVCYGLEEAGRIVFRDVLQTVYILLVQIFSLIHVWTLHGRCYIIAKVTVVSSLLWALMF